MFRTEFFTAKDVDLLVTFGGWEFEEKSKLPLRSAGMIDAARLHSSGYSDSFAVSSDGSHQFCDDEFLTGAVVSKDYRVKVPNNLWKFNGLRVLAVGSVVMMAFICVIVLNIIPRKIAGDALLSIFHSQ
jgi:hypothetical protein